MKPGQCELIRNKPQPAHSSIRRARLFGSRARGMYARAPFRREFLLLAVSSLAQSPNTLEPLLAAFPNCPPFCVGRQEKSGGRQEMTGKSGANPETRHIRLMLCWFPAKKTGVCWSQTGGSRNRREIAGKRGRQLGKAVKSGRSLGYERKVALSLLLAMPQTRQLSQHPSHFPPVLLRDPVTPCHDRVQEAARAGCVPRIGN